MSSNSDSDTNEYEIIKSPTEKFNKLYYKLFKIKTVSNIVSKLKQFKIQHNLCYSVIDFLKLKESNNNLNNLSNSAPIYNSFTNNLSTNNTIPINIQKKSNTPKKRSFEERLKLERELMQIEDMNLNQKNKQQKINNDTFNTNLPTIIQHSSNNNDVNLPNIMKQSFTQKVSKKSFKSTHLKSHVRNNASTTPKNDNHILLQSMVNTNQPTANKNIFSLCFSNFINCIEYLGKSISNGCSRMCNYIKNCFK